HDPEGLGLGIVRVTGLPVRFPPGGQVLEQLVIRVALAGSEREKVGPGQLVVQRGLTCGIASPGAPVPPSAGLDSFTLAMEESGATPYSDLGIVRLDVDCVLPDLLPDLF